MPQHAIAIESSAVYPLETTASAIPATNRASTIAASRIQRRRAACWSGSGGACSGVLTGATLALVRGWPGGGTVGLLLCSGKVLKRELRAPYWEGHSTLVAGA
jgi:hypothetical protein